MIQNLRAENHLDADGKPAGGIVTAPGLAIEWQNGPLGRDGDRLEPNGAFVETVILAARQRIAHYQDGMFASVENEIALNHLDAALSILNRRTERRERQKVEGTHFVTDGPMGA